MPDIDPPGEVPSVNASGQGTQVGSGNTQYNTWMAAARQQLDPAALAALNPHAAVARLQELRVDDLADFFARAKPDDVSEILAAFIEVDEDKVVAALADINRRQATELMSTVSVDATLAALPEAAAAISRKAAILKWTGAGSLECYAEAYVRKYRNGRVVFWLDDRGTYAMSGAIEEYWLDHDPDIGGPDGDQELTPASPFGSTGVRQGFHDHTVYSSEHGTYAVKRSVEDCYAAEGGSAGWLGFPVGEAEIAHIEYCQRFEGGTIYWRDNGELPAIAVRQQVASAIDGYPSFPFARESGNIVSSGGTSGRKQLFMVLMSESSNLVAMVYSVGGHGAALVAPSIWSYYHSLGAENSWLGFPVGGEQEYRLLPGCRIQSFEGGRIYWSAEALPIAVSGATVGAISRLFSQSAARLGFPVSEEQPVGPRKTSRIQFFENGVVTLRDGRSEVWLRPSDQ